MLKSCFLVSGGTCFLQSQLSIFFLPDTFAIQYHLKYFSIEFVVLCMYLKLNFLSVLMHYLSATLTSVSPRLLVEVSHTSCLQHSCCSIAKQHGVGCFVWRHSIASMDGIFVRYRKFISIDFSVHGPPLL